MIAQFPIDTDLCEFMERLGTAYPLMSTEQKKWVDTEISDAIINNSKTREERTWYTALWQSYIRQNIGQPSAGMR
jgi:hypothetical protein